MFSHHSVDNSSWTLSLHHVSKDAAIRKSFYQRMKDQTSDATMMMKENMFPTALILSFALVMFLCFGFASSFPLPQRLQQQRETTVLKDSKHFSVSNGKSLKKKRNALDSCIETFYSKKDKEQEQNLFLIIDTNNVRGRSDFRLTNGHLINKLQRWRQSMFPKLKILYMIDHGNQPQAFEYQGLGLVVFAGPKRSADDVIVNACRWFITDTSTREGEEEFRGQTNRNNNHVFIVTSDGELKSRCLRGNNLRFNSGKAKRKKAAGRDRIKVFGSINLLSCLEDFDRLHSASDQLQTNTNQELIESKILDIENDIRWYEYQHPPWKSGKEQLEAASFGRWTSTVLIQSFANGKNSSDDNISRNATFWEQKSFDETTWHRVLVAENLRRILDTLLLPNLPMYAKQGQYDSTAILLEYLTQYNYGSDNECSDISTANDGTNHNSLFRDHRLVYEPYMQQQLLQYLDRSVASIASLYGTESASENLSNDATEISFRSHFHPVKSCADWLRNIVKESSTKSRDDILKQYMDEAPSELQFSRKKDLIYLFTLIAVKEKRGNDRKPKWYLDPKQPNIAEESYVRKMGRRRRRYPKKWHDETDEALIQIGIQAETRWFGRLQWPTRN